MFTMNSGIGIQQFIHFVVDTTPVRAVSAITSIHILRKSYFRRFACTLVRLCKCHWRNRLEKRQLSDHSERELQKKEEIFFRCTENV